MGLGRIQNSSYLTCFVVISGEAFFILLLMKQSVLQLFIPLCMFPSLIHAQRNEVLSPEIASLQVMADNEWTNMPIIELGGDKIINISFDELSHTYHRYCYKIEHCEADWTTSTELFESDYISGFASGNTVDDYAQSVGTNQLYTNYSLRFPNDKCKLRMSGNYRITVYDEDEDNRAILKACFMVVEPRMNIKMLVSSNTDIDINSSHQQVNLSLDFGNINVTEPNTQVKTVVMQNERWDNAVINCNPQYVKKNGLEWTHCRDLIFPAGNEYRKFETLDVTHTTMGLERVGWDGSQYQAWVWTDEPRPNYAYDEDANGAFLIRNSDNINNNTESDYVIVHFRLKTTSTTFENRYANQPKEIFLNGKWTNNLFDSKYKMAWNEEEQLYEASIKLKQGYYNYQYLMKQPDGTYRPVPSEGSFFQTENKYQTLVYYRGQGERTDRLVGYNHN